MEKLKPDHEAFSNFIDKGKFILIWRLSALFSIVFFILTVFSLFYDIYETPVFFSVSFIASICWWYLHKTKRYKRVIFIYAFFATIISAIALFLPVPNLHFGEIMWYFSVIVFIFIGLGRKIALYFVVFILITLGTFIYFQINTSIARLHPLSVAERVGLIVEVFFALFSVVYLLHQYLVFQSYSDAQMDLANRELVYQNNIIQSKNKENSVLLREVHHRVKNNLQLIVSLLRMQSAEIKHEETKKHFAEAIHRIVAMSLIHQKLYSDKTVTQIDVNDYFNELVHGLVDSMYNSTEAIEIKIETEIHFLDLETIMSLGLILNELVTNSIKHAFGNSDKKRIEISLLPKANKHIELSYFDNGTWVVNTEKQRGFGKELIYLLADQINAKVKREDSHYILMFPQEEKTRLDRF